jgi:hypothetical protein
MLAVGLTSRPRGSGQGYAVPGLKVVMTIRFVISDITPNSCRFEQAFSADGGKTWEINWVATHG